VLLFRRAENQNDILLVCVRAMILLDTLFIHAVKLTNCALLTEVMEVLKVMNDLDC